MTPLWLSRSTAALAAATALAVTALAAPAAAAPSLTVSKSTGLVPGDKVTVSAKGLSPNQPFVPLGLCKPNPAGPTDCATAPESSVIGKTDASGVWHSASSNGTTARITVKAKVGGVDCTAKAGACVIAVSITATRELAQVPLTVGAGGTTSPSPSTPPATSGATTSGGVGSLPETGSSDGIPVALLGGGTLLVLGASVMLLVRRRRAGTD
ncbi:neocarzinostatin apoprotein domain-containing protein [Streptomyces gobiensis]|uniref:neocarzinostatin apoprotein domain-containing protein n=1 Tax=Streptomyces gobiensis TaxID=2875706 RepID=UPI001E3C257F|nr:neocarzinostatin apoprotein domain-containing protein [Streptomyces gobiensis]UGY91925.1 LPXTG cell wall anchor domain-containing protein [Streptomyces gobiensis]